MQEIQYQFLFPIGKIGNVNGHPGEDVMDDYEMSDEEEDNDVSDSD